MNVVLVHGAWADGSSWLPVIERLQARAHHVVAVQLPMTSLEADVEATRRAIAGIDAEVVVGHSYGGFVITAAVAAAPSVRGLVFVAAYTPLVGESIASISHSANEMPGGRAIVYGEDGWTSIDPSAYGSALGHDLPQATQRALAAVQAPTHVSCFVSANTAVIPDGMVCHYVISAGDRILDPQLQRALADRLDASVTRLTGSHLALLSRPDAVAVAIEATIERVAARMGTPARVQTGGPR